MLTRFRSFAAAPLAVAALLFTVASATPAHASVIYRYTGNLFTSATVDGPTTPAEVYTTDDRVTVVMQLAAPLAANMGYQSITPLSFRFTDGLHTLTNANAWAAFDVETDGSGNISSWNARATISAVKDGGGTVVFIGTSNFGMVPFSSVVDTGTEVLCGPGSTPNGCDFFGDPFYAQTGSVYDAPGAWSRQVPEPASLLFVGAAIAGVAARRRRR